MASGDLGSKLMPGWAVTDRRGRPALTPTNKRKQEIVETENDHKNPDSALQKKPTILSDGNGSAEATADNFQDWEKVPQPGNGDGEFTKLGGSEPEQFPICKNCLKEMKRYLTLEGDFGEEEAYSSITVESSEKRVGKEEKKPRRRRKEVDRHPSVCSWCKKSFVSRFALAAHSRFCRWKQSGIVIGNRRESRRVAPARNFDLNQLPPE